MRVKSKFDYEIENFVSAFGERREKRIALYGTGRMTATLVNGVEGFKIVGLCDRDSSLIGKKMYGLPILGRDEVEQQADFVVINTSATYWGTIYHRIKEWNIPIYFLNGELAQEQINELPDDPYWNKSFEELRKIIDKYDIVSFDIFDTLVMRKVMFPIDIFRLTEIQLDRISGTKTDFTTIRKKAAAMLENPTLDEIYIKMQEFTQKSKAELEKWKKKEIDTEKILLAARNDMVSLCKRAMENKQVFFVSDMYYSSEVLQEILEKVGILAEQKQIIVSCEQKKTKEDGTLWNYYKKNIVKNSKAIHIGDNENADVLNAQRYGITGYYILNPYEMLQKSSIKTIAPTIESIYSSMAMGLICAKIFNSPFALNKMRGKICFADEEEAGYCLLGSLLYSFMEWLIEKAKEDGIRELVFFAREGYLLIPIYNYLREVRKEKNLPKAVYLEISRRAVWNASISSEEEIYEIAQFPYCGNLGQFLEERFGIREEKKEILQASVGEKQTSMKSLKNLIGCYKEEILRRSQEERENYQAYFDSLKIKEKYAVVDSQFYGSTQHYLGKILGKKLKGYYFCACTSEDNRYLRSNEMYGCFQGDTGSQAKDTNVHRQAQFLEAFFTAPKGMLEYIESDGDRKYTERMSNQKHFDVRLEMVKGINKFIYQMGIVQQELVLEEKDDVWSDKMFGCFMNQGFVPSEKMKISFFFDNYAANKREMPIWE